MAGIYAVMSFTVARRTREIGLRVALGARPIRVVGAVFKRPLTHIAVGLGAGLVISVLLGWGIEGDRLVELWGWPLVALLGYVAFMGSVCLGACADPTRRALAVEPNEALRADR